MEEGEPLSSRDVAAALGLDVAVVGRVGRRLADDGLLTSISMGLASSTIAVFTEVTAKGRREVGQWPSPDVAADRLMAALDQAIERAPEGEQRTWLQKARSGLVGAGRDVVVDLTAAIISRQVGA
ncbi:hypothetical protein [Modestobacter sp. I12A-02662]|uniref:hypothetical protein n=1 Tax=Modestobacter sp. I12A-02662 TaxID=1730496 RepID=UPI0034DE6B90